jgi:guanylate kinase
MIVVISGPGGVGKGTLVDRLVELDDRLWLSRSWTTRQRRPGEAPDAYRFVSPEQFQAHIEADGFLEWVEFLDYRQGSPVPEVPPGRDALFEIDVVGAAAIKERYPDALTIFVDAPSREEQRRRLVGRGDPPEVVERRLAKAEAEASAAVEMHSVIVINDDLDRALAELAELVADRRRELQGSA